MAQGYKFTALMRRPEATVTRPNACFPHPEALSPDAAVSCQVILGQKEARGLPDALSVESK